MILNNRVLLTAIFVSLLLGGFAGYYVSDRETLEIAYNVEVRGNIQSTKRHIDYLNGLLKQDQQAIQESIDFTIKYLESNLRSCINDKDCWLDHKNESKSVLDSLKKAQEKLLEQSN